ncbi:hypothetical protein [Alkalihalobacillus pseudalcaliphilus]|uniref:hypothetical protein n=1 Tax=Alkalihalobacillus pseudalcaliphilus TaxID=79884 RepID=UPI000ACBDF4B|nr:hypothetical protein [Alkalihalobacillus pseudalcaliphilus]
MNSVDIFKDIISIMYKDYAGLNENKGAPTDSFLEKILKIHLNEEEFFSISD